MAISIYDNADPGTTVTVSGNTLMGKGTITAINIRNAQPVIKSNRIENFNTGIKIDGATRHTEPAVTYNGFTGCNTATQLEGDAAPVINYNNINTQTQWQVYNNTPNNIDATYNWWGPEATDSMNTLGPTANIASIYDSLDVDSLGHVDFSNWYTEEVPVVLASFTAAAGPEGVTLAWTTQSEAENLGFNVLRSSSVTGQFGRVNKTLIPGAGTSSEPHHYTFTDADVTAGTWYYKLAQVDLSGGRYYSDVIKVIVDPVGIIPGSGTVPTGRITLDRTRLLDVRGLPVPQHGKLAPGVYFLRQEGQLLKVLVRE
jgi:hypothetical protein